MTRIRQLKILKFIYFLIATTEIDNLNKKISGLESIIVNELKETNINTETSDNKYTKITEDLEEIDVLYVTDVINNNDTYTLRGVLYTRYTLSNEELQKILNKGTMKINDKNYTIKNSKDSNEYDLYELNSESPLYKIKQINSNSYYLEAQSQISDVWKLTDEYREITVSSNTKCSMVFDDEKNIILLKMYLKILIKLNQLKQLIQMLIKHLHLNLKMANV